MACQRAKIQEIRSFLVSLTQQCAALIWPPGQVHPQRRILDSLATSINYSSCHDVVQLYSVRHSGDMARIRDTAPVICRGFVIFEGASCQEASKASAAHPSLTAPAAVPARRRSKNPGDNLTPNCVTITEPGVNRMEQKFSVPRSARIARRDSRLGCRQIPAQAIHDQSVDLLKELLRDSDVFLALRIDGLREHYNVGFPCRHYPTCSAASP
jgi:hypothetical protein